MTAMEQVAAARSITETLTHECDWTDNTGRFEGCPSCLRCQLDQALGGTDANGETP